jgi:hypothetical protein
VASVWTVGQRILAVYRSAQAAADEPVASDSADPGPGP